MGIIMTNEQRQIFNEGARFSFEFLGAYVRYFWDKKPANEEEKKKMFYDFVSFLGETSEINRNMQLMIARATKTKNISEENQYFFKEGVKEHTNYVLYCFQQELLMNFYSNFKAYFLREKDALPNDLNADFYEWLKLYTD